MSKHLTSIHSHQLLSWILFSCDLGCILRHFFGKHVPSRDSQVLRTTMWSEMCLYQWNTKSVSAALITSVSTEEGPPPSPLLKDYSGVCLIERE